MPHALPIVLLLALVSLASRAADLPPIKDLSGVKPQPTVFNVAKATAPLVIASEKDAAEHFDKDELAKLAKEVDFTKQVVLVFAWRGSGGDKLDYAVAESSPEQVFFTLTRGRTRDLREHVRIYVLRSNVKWSVK